MVTSKSPQTPWNSRAIYWLACHPSTSYSASFGYHCAMDKATPSALFLPDLRICTGTCPLKIISKVDFLPALIGVFKFTFKIVPITSYLTGFPFCFNEIIF